MDENMNFNNRIDAFDPVSAEADSAIIHQTLPDSQWMMDSKFGNISLSLSSNENYCGLFNDDLDLLSDLMDYGSTNEQLHPEVLLQCDVMEQCTDQLSSPSPENCSVDQSLSSVEISSENFNVSSSSDSNFDLVASSTLIEECNSTVPDIDLFSMLLCDNETPLEEVLDKMETAALHQSVEVVRLDHDYTKKESPQLPKEKPSSVIVNMETDSMFLEPQPFSKKKKFAEVERRSRNNEASRRSRAIRKEKFKKMENDAQRLAADNQRMRVLLRDMESVAKRCKDQLVSSIGKKG